MCWLFIHCCWHLPHVNWEGFTYWQQHTQWLSSKEFPVTGIIVDYINQSCPSSSINKSIISVIIYYPHFGDWTRGEEMDGSDRFDVEQKPFIRVHFQKHDKTKSTGTGRWTFRMNGIFPFVLPQNEVCDGGIGSAVRAHLRWWKPDAVEALKQMLTGSVASWERVLDTLEFIPSSCQWSEEKVQ